MHSSLSKVKPPELTASTQLPLRFKLTSVHFSDLKIMPENNIPLNPAAVQGKIFENLAA